MHSFTTSFGKKIPWSFVIWMYCKKQFDDYICALVVLTQIYSYNSLKNLIWSSQWIINQTTNETLIFYLIKFLSLHIRLNSNSLLHWCNYWITSGHAKSFRYCFYIFLLHENNSFLNINELYTYIQVCYSQVFAS